MKTNEKQNVKTDWAISGIVKPDHMNSLTRHVPYDYIITDKMLEGKDGSIDVDLLLNPANPDTGDEGGGMIHGRTGEYHVLINTPVPDNIILEFPARSIGDGEGELKVHVYAFGPYKARVTPGASAPNPHITHYFHTAGEENAVTFYSLDVDFENLSDWHLSSIKGKAAVGIIYIPITERHLVPFPTSLRHKMPQLSARRG